MRFTLVPSDAHETAAARQLAAGFSKLEFEPTLETEFRRAFRHGQLLWMRAGFGVLIVLAPLLWLVDHWQLPLSLNEVSVTLRLVVMLTLGMLGFGLTYVLARRAALPRIATVLVIGMALAAMLIDWFVVREGAGYAFSGLPTILVAGFLAFGLTFWTALDVMGALALMAVAVVAFAGWPMAQVIPYTLVLFTSVGAGAAAAYAFEHAARTAWLQTLIIGHLGERDGLTHLFNRRMFDRYLEQAWHQAIMDSALLVLMLVDIDRFRRFNDRYGLRSGDECLRRVAAAVRDAALRPLDFCARYSGVQFALLVSNPDRLYAEEIPVKVRQKIAALGIEHRDSPDGQHLTVSIGVALAVPREGDSREDFIELAQTALRDAREQGGDRVCFREADSAMTQTGMFEAEVALTGTRGS